MLTDTRLPAHERIKLLTVQGELFRAGVVSAQQAMVQELEPRRLLKHAAAQVVDRSGEAARQLLTVDALLDGRLAMLLPLASKSVGFLARRRLLKPAVITLSAAGAAWYGLKVWRERRSATPSADAMPPDARIGDAASAEAREID